MSSIVIGAVVVILLVLFQFAEGWTLVGHVIEGLKNSGPIGAAFANLLTSRTVPLVLAVVILGMAFDVWRKQRETAQEHDELAPIHAEIKTQNSGNMTATGGSVTLVVGEKSVPRAAFEPPPQNAPNLAIVRVWRRAIYLRGDIWSLFDSHGPSRKVEAIYAEIKNAKDELRAVGPALGVKAELIVTSKVERAEYAPLAWLDTEFNTENFQFGETHHVLLAVNLTPGTEVGDWRIVLNQRGFNDPAPGLVKMEFDHFWTSGTEKKLELNLLHIKSGTMICSAVGTYQLVKGRLEIVFP